MNGHNNGWRSVGPHRDFERKPMPEQGQSFLRGEVHGRLDRIDSALKVGDVARARALIEGWIKELRIGAWPSWMK